MLFSSWDTSRTLMHLFLFKYTPRENWFQYVHRKYATAINFSCLITLYRTMCTVCIYLYRTASYKYISSINQYKDCLVSYLLVPARLVWCTHRVLCNRIRRAEEQWLYKLTSFINVRKKAHKTNICSCPPKTKTKKQ